MLSNDQLLLLARAKLAALQAKQQPIAEAIAETEKEESKLTTAISVAKDLQNTVILESKLLQGELIWNKEQQDAINLAETGEDLVLVGKAGTGKTTAVRHIVKRAMQSGRIGPLQHSTKFLRAGLAGVCVVSFTNRAVKNLAKGMPRDLQGNCLTIHKLLEFEPTPFEYKDADGEWKTSMRFEPKRNELNPLPPSLKCIIFEESSMISTELFAQLMAALPHKCQFIFLGDLQQLPPVYGTAILGYKMLELPVIELTQIYRQAADSPIISLAWDVATGKQIAPEVTTIKDEETGKSTSEFSFPKYDVPGKLKFRCWKKKLDSDDALHIIGKLFNQFIDAGIYNPEEDMIMLPFNKKFGTLELNKNIAQYLGKKRKAIVYEIIAGFQKHYYAVGDKVLVEKQEAIVQEIVINGRFVSSVVPLSPSEHLNRWGVYNMDDEEGSVKEEDDGDPDKELKDIEDFLNLTMSSTSGEDDEIKQQASHVMKCKVIGSDDIIEISTAGEFSATLFGYALTVHKCQGSEWRQCFLVLHRSHAVMLNRELLYTAVTRARESLFILCEPDSFVKGVATQRIKGNTIAEKAEYFKGKQEEKKGLL